MSENSNENIVREFHHILLWPIQLRPLKREKNGAIPNYWDVLKRKPGEWKYIQDSLLLNDETCRSGYEEFVYFLPYVQRFLYGVGEVGQGAQSSVHIFQRQDVRKIRVKIRRDGQPIDLDVQRLHLYFFYDVDIALLAFEISAKDMPLDQVCELMDRLGRPYPPAWLPDGEAAHTNENIIFLNQLGKELASSDYDEQEKYINLVRDVRQTPLSSHWEFLMSPLVPAYKSAGAIKFYQIENKRIPIMTYLSFDDPRLLTRGDMIRLGFAAKWGPSDSLPYSGSFLQDFEVKHCYDRYWDPSDARLGFNTRYMFCGTAFTVMTRYQDERTDLLHHFRRQFFQIGLIAHFHKAALLNLSNRFSRAVERLNIRDLESVRIFKREVRETLEEFLRFNHRYWFQEISNQVQASDFFVRWKNQLDTNALYNEVREEAHDINQYLDNDRARKQTDNAMRLTVVSACGMVGTIVTGFLGMNLYAHAELPLAEKLLIFIAVFIPTVALAMYTVAISRRLANFMEALSSEGLSWQEKIRMLRQIWAGSKKQKELIRRESEGLSGE